MEKIDAAKFKEQCLMLLDRLDADGLIVTMNGRPVARILPIESQDADLIGSLRHKIAVRGGILSTGLVWDTYQQPPQPGGRTANPA